MSGSCLSGLVVQLAVLKQVAFSNCARLRIGHVRRGAALTRGACTTLFCSQRVSSRTLPLAGKRYDTKLWMRDLMEGAAYLPK